MEVDATIVKEGLFNGALGSNPNERPSPVGPSVSCGCPYQLRSLACLERREFAHAAYGVVAPSAIHLAAQHKQAGMRGAAHIVILALLGGHCSDYGTAIHIGGCSLA